MVRLRVNEGYRPLIESRLRQQGLLNALTPQVQPAKEGA